MTREGADLPHFLTGILSFYLRKLEDNFLILILMPFHKQWEAVGYPEEYCPRVPSFQNTAIAWYRSHRYSFILVWIP
jgi:hypothetical protein